MPRSQSEKDEFRIGGVSRGSAGGACQAQPIGDKRLMSESWAPARPWSPSGADNTCRIHAMKIHSMHGRTRSVGPREIGRVFGTIRSKWDRSEALREFALRRSSREREKGREFQTDVKIIGIDKSNQQVLIRV